MSKYKGQILNLGTIDKCGRKFAEDCKITFPELVPVNYNFDPYVVLGTADITRNERGIACEVTVIPGNENFVGDECFVGGYYTDIKQHEEDGVLVIDSGRLVSMSIVPDGYVADPDLTIDKED